MRRTQKEMGEMFLWDIGPSSISDVDSTLSSTGSRPEISADSTVTYTSVASAFSSVYKYFLYLGIRRLLRLLPRHVSNFRVSSIRVGADSLKNERGGRERRLTCDSERRSTGQGASRGDWQVVSMSEINITIL